MSDAAPESFDSYEASASATTEPRFTDWLRDSWIRSARRFRPASKGAWRGYLNGQSSWKSTSSRLPTTLNK